MSQICLKRNETAKTHTKNAMNLPKAIRSWAYGLKTRQNHTIEIQRVKNYHDAAECQHKTAERARNWHMSMCFAVYVHLNAFLSLLLLIIKSHALSCVLLNSPLCCAIYRPMIVSYCFFMQSYFSLNSTLKTTPHTLNPNPSS